MANPAVQIPTNMTMGSVSETLADVVELPVDVPSFYQKNSGSLPKTGRDVSDTHRRANLPSATNDIDSLFVRLRQIIGL